MQNPLQKADNSSRTLSSNYTAVMRRRRRRRRRKKRKTTQEELIQNLHEDGITRRYALKHVSGDVLHPCETFGNWQ
jgi:predicted transcriptional regulator YheO